jgi:hypothetical protein
MTGSIIYTPNSIRMIKSRVIRWARHVAHTKERQEMHTEFSLECLKGRNHLEDLSIGERIILKWILGK